MIQYDMIWYNTSWAYKWEWLARCATHGNSTNLWLKLGFFFKKKKYQSTIMLVIILSLNLDKIIYQHFISNIITCWKPRSINYIE